ncbi:hypothetical protein EXIGLDRAFT_774114 [Exidia glandulosa HHB12029]|uniref:Uncharacterized protein n=1 Tax=Exidia glandulosa HHB12029 TaxID=1314781 RepID=A0A165ZZ03_EXIGL|nr:hypothetical protein EXIGLDRAFT_774114 [Exidia glandulosa HHB12029]
MDQAYMDKKIVDLSDAELVNLSFLGPNVAPGIKRLVEKLPASAISPISPTISEAETLYSELNIDSTALTVVAPDLISQYVRNFYYHGVPSAP